MRGRTRPDDSRGWEMKGTLQVNPDIIPRTSTMPLRTVALCLIAHGAPRGPGPNTEAKGQR